MEIDMPEFMPLRMCAGCRTRYPKQELLRIVRTAEGAAADLAQKLPGRGAYLCKWEACIKTARKKKAFSRQFQRAVPDSFYEELLDYVKE